MVKPLVSIIMGSDSDLYIMQEAGKVLKEFKIPFEITIVSAHRTPKRLFEFAEKAHQRGIQVIIAGAGGAAHPDIKIIGLPGDVGQVFSVRRESRGEVNIGMGGHLLQVEGLSRGCSRGWSSRLHRRVHRGGRLCEKAGH